MERHSAGTFKACASFAIVSGLIEDRLVAANARTVLKGLNGALARHAKGIN